MAAPREESIFDKVAATTDEAIQRPFRFLGEMNGKSPIKVMASCFIICVLCSMGMMHISDVTESRSDKLWFPQDTRSNTDRNKYEVRNRVSRRCVGRFSFRMIVPLIVAFTPGQLPTVGRSFFGYRRESQRQRCAHFRRFVGPHGAPPRGRCIHDVERRRPRGAMRAV